MPEVEVKNLEITPKPKCLRCGSEHVVSDLGHWMPGWFTCQICNAVDHAHRAGLPVKVWTVNDPHDMRRLLEWGVDALISDRPDLAVAAVRGRPGA